MTDDYMPDPERRVAYKLLDPGFTKVFAFGTVFGQIGYIIADSWEDAYEELLDHAYEVDGPCDHGNDPELKALMERAQQIHDAGHDASDEWYLCYQWVDEHCDCEQSSNGPVWMVDNWWHREMRGYDPLALARDLRNHAPTAAEMSERLDQLVEWYEPEEDDDEDQ